MGFSLGLGCRGQGGLLAPRRQSGLARAPAPGPLDPVGGVPLLGRWAGVADGVLADAGEVDLADGRAPDVLGLAGVEEDEEALRGVLDVLAGEVALVLPVGRA